MRAALALLAALLAAPALAAPAADWTRSVSDGAGGSYVMGNPRSTRVVEYVSYTCPHCGHFVNEASEPLRRDWVRPGIVSLEVRHAVRDPYDLTAAVLARCGGRDSFFAAHEALFANQDKWLERVQAYEAGRANRPAPGDMAAQLTDIAQRTGLTDFMAKRGLTPARQRTCFADKRTPELLAAMAKDAWETRKIGGTPSFSVGGRMVGAHDWAGLRAALPAPSN